MELMKLFLPIWLRLEQISVLDVTLTLINLQQPDEDSQGQGVRVRVRGEGDQHPLVMLLISQQKRFQITSNLRSSFYPVVELSGLSNLLLLFSSLSWQECRTTRT